MRLFSYIFGTSKEKRKEQVYSSMSSKKIVLYQKNLQMVTIFFLHFLFIIIYFLLYYILLYYIIYFIISYYFIICIKINGKKKNFSKLCCSINIKFKAE